MADELVQFAALVPSELGIRDRQLDEAWQGSIMHSMMALVRVDDEDHFEDLSGDEEAAEDDDDSLVPSSESERSISGSESEGSARNSSGTEQDEEAQDEEAQDEDDEDATQDEDAQDEDDEDATRYTIYISMTADGTEVQKNRSFTPVTSKILNLRSGLRSRMSNILLHAVFPESVQDYNMLLHPVALQLRQHRPDGGDPIRIRHPRTGTRMHLYVQLAVSTNVVLFGFVILEPALASKFENGIGVFTAVIVTFALFVTIKYSAAVGALFACCQVPSPRK